MRKKWEEITFNLLANFNIIVPTLFILKAKEGKTFPRLNFADLYFRSNLGSICMHLDIIYRFIA